MPIFDFKCRQCGHSFDIMIPNADKDKVRCPECGALILPNYCPSFNTAGGPGVNKPAPDGCSGCAAAGTVAEDKF